MPRSLAGSLMGIDITCPLCGIQRDINHPSSRFGRQPNVTPTHQKTEFQSRMQSILQLKRVQAETSMSERPNQPQSGSKAKPDGGFPQIFQSGAKDSNSAFFQQYLRKMQLLSLKNPLSDEKDSKSVKKRLKKGLTRGRNRDIITELSARATSPPDGMDP